MNVKEKIAYAQNVIKSIAEHDDASKDEVEKALADVSKFAGDAKANGLAGREARIKKRADERNAKLEAKRAAKAE
jgi:hypothetical protein